MRRTSLIPIKAGVLAHEMIENHFKKRAINYEKYSKSEIKVAKILFAGFFKWYRRRHKCK